MYEFQPSHEGVSEVSEQARKHANRASEQRERSETERCGVRELSERCERTNVASDATEWLFQNAIVTRRNRP